MMSHLNDDYIKYYKNLNLSSLNVNFVFVWDDSKIDIHGRGEIIGV